MHTSIPKWMQHNNGGQLQNKHVNTLTGLTQESSVKSTTGPQEVQTCVTAQVNLHEAQPDCTST